MSDSFKAQLADRPEDRVRRVRQSWESILAAPRTDSGLEAELAAIGVDATMIQFFDIDRRIAVLRRDLESGLSRLRRTVLWACGSMIAAVAFAVALVIARS